MRPQRIEPGPGQESVWDYPRPPRLEPCTKQIQVICNGLTLVETRSALRVLETSSPPVYYLPPQDCKMEHFLPTTHHSYCEWKGQASYYTIQVGERKIVNGAWYYPRPTRGYEALANYIAIYSSHMDGCYIDGEKVQAQEGDFYGGWITHEIIGPFKGGPGTYGW
ncbi:DUF427 domain-containing protein [Tengunoibacter tsumagoiensis]|uniref:DUF427 domain-containing protein n=1 Tax=Tengunoibacter tsumagoiensis TaxID=2014871 RepID=A0A402A5N4_9CHLR|nr:DUF427 domain-containing protein [Tengunoibacter tsumagoiensis]GCE14331.1 hypothetical protein KTT_41900 [Tengunoibacter tsumagoiensis]